MLSFNQIVGFGNDPTEAIYHAKSGLAYHGLEFESIKCTKTKSYHYRVKVKDMSMWLNIVETRNEVYKAGLSPVYPCDCF